MLFLLAKIQLNRKPCGSGRTRTNCAGQIGDTDFHFAAAAAAAAEAELRDERGPGNARPPAPGPPRRATGAACQDPSRPIQRRFVIARLSAQPQAMLVADAS